MKQKIKILTVIGLMTVGMSACHNTSKPSNTDSVFFNRKKAPTNRQTSKTTVLFPTIIQNRTRKLPHFIR